MGFFRKDTKPHAEVQFRREGRIIRMSINFWNVPDGMNYESLQLSADSEEIALGIAHRECKRRKLDLRDFPVEWERTA